MKTSTNFSISRKSFHLTFILQAYIYRHSIYYYITPAYVLHNNVRCVRRARAVECWYRRAFFFAAPTARNNAWHLTRGNVKRTNWSSIHFITFVACLPFLLPWHQTFLADIFFAILMWRIYVYDVVMHVCTCMCFCKVLGLLDKLNSPVKLLMDSCCNLQICISRSKLTCFSVSVCKTRSLLPAAHAH